MSYSAWRELQTFAAPYAKRYGDALKSPRSTQKNILMDILDRNKHCEFGQKYNFENIRSIKQFQDQIPMQDYGGFRPYTERMANGVAGTLLSDPIVCFEQTSGTGAEPKFIAYTHRSLEDFRSALFPWLFDICSQIPGVAKGRAYWSISPIGREQLKTSAGVPIGLDNDALYFGESVAHLIQETLAVPPWVAAIKSIDDWQYVTLRYLLSDADLTLISIWSPTFLLRLLDALPKHRTQLIDDITTGDMSYPHLAPFREKIRGRPDPDRANLVADATSASKINTQKLWPDLSLISCWTSASSSLYAKQLKTLFPHAPVQAKGLLATEGAVTTPLFAAKAPVLSLLSGFYEFLADDGEVYLADQLSTGKTYSIALTNNSGLYRYLIGDRVKVVNWQDATPCLEFVGRSTLTSDLCGEKLTEFFVLSHLQSIPGFSFLVANPMPVAHYCLYVDSERISQAQSAVYAEKLDCALKENPHYRYARQLHQLGPIRVLRATDPLDSYYQRLLNKAALGDIKPPSLSQDIAWHNCFRLHS